MTALILTAAVIGAVILVCREGVRRDRSASAEFDREHGPAGEGGRW